MEQNENSTIKNEDPRVPATIALRILAAGIDRFFCLLFLLLLSLFYQQQSSTFFRILRLGELMVPTVIFYHIALEFFWHGQTLGKKLCRIRVVTESGKPLEAMDIFTRNLLRFTDVLPLLYLAGIISIMRSKKRQRLGDIAAQTLVVCEERIFRSQEVAANKKVWINQPTDMT